MSKYYIDLSNNKSIQIDFTRIYDFLPILIESTTLYQKSYKDEFHYVLGLVNIDDEYEMKLVKELNKFIEENINDRK